MSTPPASVLKIVDITGRSEEAGFDMEYIQGTFFYFLASCKNRHSFISKKNREWRHSALHPDPVCLSGSDFRAGGCGGAKERNPSVSISYQDVLLDLSPLVW
jgi:hypothetical protein